MNSPLAIPAELIQDAVAYVDADGRFHPVNDAMRGWVTTVAASIDELPLSKDQFDELLIGSEVRVTAAGVCWQLKRTQVVDVAWLVVRDITATDRLEASCLATARSRSLGAMAATIAHELNNQFNLVLALTAQLDELITKPNDRQSIHELEIATTAGARLLSILAHLLISRKRCREILQPSEFLADAALIVEKSMIQNGVDLQVASAHGLPPIRGSHVEIVQAVMEGLVALLECGAKSITCTMGREASAIGGGRSRECIMLRCQASPADSVAVASLRKIVDGHAGMLAEVCSHSDVLLGLANAVLVQKRMGGDLIMATEGRDVCLQFVWPAVVQASR